MVDVERGRREGAALSRELEGRNSVAFGEEYRPVNMDAGDLENRHED